MAVISLILSGVYRQSHRRQGVAPSPQSLPHCVKCVGSFGSCIFIMHPPAILVRAAGERLCASVDHTLHIVAGRSMPMPSGVDNTSASKLCTCIYRPSPLGSNSYQLALFGRRRPCTRSRPCCLRFGGGCTCGCLRFGGGCTCEGRMPMPILPSITQPQLQMSIANIPIVGNAQ